MATVENDPKLRVREGLLYNGFHFDRFFFRHERLPFLLPGPRFPKPAKQQDYPDTFSNSARTSWIPLEASMGINFPRSL